MEVRRQDYAPTALPQEKCLRYPLNEKIGEVRPSPPDLAYVVLRTEISLAILGTETCFPGHTALTLVAGSVTLSPLLCHELKK
jgi:hypothetical protein